MTEQLVGAIDQMNNHVGVVRSPSGGYGGLWSNAGHPRRGYCAPIRSGTDPGGDTRNAAQPSVKPAPSPSPPSDENENGRGEGTENPTTPPRFFFWRGHR